MLLLRLSLVIALLPGLYGLWQGGAALTQPTRTNQQLQDQLLLRSPLQWRRADLAQMARQHGLWALSVRDRAGRPLQDWQSPLWDWADTLGLSQTLFGPAQSLSDRATGAQWNYVPATVAAPGAVWLLLSMAYCSLILAGFWQLNALRRPQDLVDVAQRLGNHLPVRPSSAPILRPRLKAYLDSAPFALAILDAQGHILYANRVLGQWQGKEPTILRQTAFLADFSLVAVTSLLGEAEALPEVAGPCPGSGVYELDTVPAKRVILHSEPGPDGGYLVAMTDLGDTLSALKKSGDDRKLLQHIVDVLPVGILVCTDKGIISMANRTAARQFAWGPGEIEGESISKLMPVPFLNQPDIGLADYRGGQSSQTSLPKVVGWRKDATTFPVGLTVEDLAGHAGDLLVLVEDQTEAQRTATAQSRLGRLFEQTAEEVLILDARSLYVREANRGAQDNLGFDLTQLRRMTLFHLAPELQTDNVEQQLARLRAGEQRELRLNTLFRRDDKSDYPVAVSLTCSREEEPPVLMLLAHDVTALRAAESRLAWMSGHDSLTRLYNRSAALEELARASREDAGVLVGLLALDGVPRINQDYGHDQGDVVLATLGERLQEQFTEARLLARWSGSTFLLLLHEEPDDFDRIMAALAAPIDLGHERVQIGLSLGLSALERRYESSLVRATGALDSAREAGGGWRLAEAAQA